MTIFKQIMRKAFLLSVMLLLAAPMYSQNAVDSMFVDLRSSFHQETTNGVYDSQIRGEHLNFHMHGHITRDINYRIRHSLCKLPIVPNNAFNATDIMYVNWNMNEHWSFLAGKYAVLIGGYEYDAAPIDVYYYSKFCNNIYQGFTFGASATYHFSRKQAVVAQICNSPLSLGVSNIYAYNLGWTGEFMPWWKTIWTFNMVEDQQHKFINYISLGNHFILGDAILDLDVMNRGNFSQSRFLFSDMTLISKFIWSVGDWNLCAKAGYEWNKEFNVDGNGRAYDLVIAPGTEYVYAGCGLEWFPFGRDGLRLHAVYYRDSDGRRNNFELGITCRLDIIR